MHVPRVLRMSGVSRLTVRLIVAVLGIPHAVRGLWSLRLPSVDHVAAPVPVRMPNGKRFDETYSLPVDYIPVIFAVFDAPLGASAGRR